MSPFGNGRAATPPPRPPTNCRYSRSLMATYALIGSRRETEVSSVDGPTRSPICPWAIPAIPSVSERTLVNSRLSWAAFAAALAELTVAAAASLTWVSVSSWLRGMARASASGMSRATSRVARPSCATACATCARA